MTMQLRKHQREVAAVIDGIIAGSPIKTISVNATPGSGKSLIPLIAGRLVTAGMADRLAWVCPRLSLPEQIQSDPPSCALRSDARRHMKNI